MSSQLSCLVKNVNKDIMATTHVLSYPRHQRVTRSNTTSMFKLSLPMPHVYKIFVSASDVLSREAPESIKSLYQSWYLFSKNLSTLGSCLVQTLLQKYQHSLSCPRLFFFQRPESHRLKFSVYTYSKSRSSISISTKSSSQQPMSSGPLLRARNYNIYLESQQQPSMCIKFSRHHPMSSAKGHQRLRSCRFKSNIYIQNYLHTHICVPLYVPSSVSLSPRQTPQPLYSKSCSSLTCVQNLHLNNVCPLLGARHHKDDQIQPNVYIQNRTSHSHVHKFSENTLICIKYTMQQWMFSPLFLGTSPTPERLLNRPQYIYSKSRISLPCVPKIRQHPHMYKIFATATYVLCSSAHKNQTPYIYLKPHQPLSCVESIYCPISCSLLRSSASQTQNHQFKCPIYIQKGYNHMHISAPDRPPKPSPSRIMSSSLQHPQDQNQKVVGSSPMSLLKSSFKTAHVLSSASPRLEEESCQIKCSVPVSKASVKRTMAFLCFSAPDTGKRNKAHLSPMSPF